MDRGESSLRWPSVTELKLKPTRIGSVLLDRSGVVGDDVDDLARPLVVFLVSDERVGDLDLADEELEVEPVGLPPVPLFVLLGLDVPPPRRPSSGRRDAG